MHTAFTIPGEPKGKGRPRMTKTGHIYTPSDTVSYENLVRICYGQTRHERMEGAVFVTICAYFKIPSGSKAKTAGMLSGALCPTKKPDADNIAKVILDSLNGVAYGDDKDVISLTVEKQFAAVPRVEVYLTDGKA